MRCAFAFGSQDVDDGRNIMTEDLKGSVIKPSQLQCGSQTLVLSVSGTSRVPVSPPISIVTSYLQTRKPYQPLQFLLLNHERHLQMYRVK
jgi:hypothetical protein